jgi:hypothetical protein
MPMGTKYEVREHGLYVIPVRVRRGNLDVQPDERRKYEMSERERTTIRGIREMKSGKGGECDQFHWLSSGYNGLWSEWGGSMKDQRFQLGQLAHCISPALKIGPFCVVTVQ